jgi:hypothetical protein
MTKNVIKAISVRHSHTIYEGILTGPSNKEDVKDRVMLSSGLTGVTNVCSNGTFNIADAGSDDWVIVRRRGPQKGKIESGLRKTG